MSFVNEVFIAVNEAMFAFGTSLSMHVAEIILALIIIAFGIFVGKFTKYILRWIFEKTRIEVFFKHDVIDTFLTIVKWSVYIFFISIALKQLSIPILSVYLSAALDIVVQLIGSFVIIIVGYAVGVFLKDSVEKIGKKEWKHLGLILFYFTLYISIAYALLLAFSSEPELANNIVLIFSAVVLVLFGWNAAKQQMLKPSKNIFHYTGKK